MSASQHLLIPQRLESAARAFQLRQARLAALHARRAFVLHSLADGIHRFGWTVERFPRPLRTAGFDVHLGERKRELQGVWVPGEESFEQRDRLGPVAFPRKNR